MVHELLLCSTPDYLRTLLLHLCSLYRHHLYYTKEHLAIGQGDIWTRRRVPT